MRKSTLCLLVAAGLAASATAGRAQTHPTGPAAPYQPVSALVDLPDFIPGMGTLYVDPATLPAGPFLAFDRDGRLVSTIYMIPLAGMNEHRNFEGLAVGGAGVDHVDIQYNAGHPGVAEPHYHVVLWTVSAEKAAELR
ncbi:MAG TPA: hypothetical protein VIE68_07830 [Gemmatimonadota bacterium]|jgi:hypothetical protein